MLRSNIPRSCRPLPQPASSRMATLQMPPKRKAVKNQPLAGSPSLSKKAKSAGAAFTARNSTMFGSSGGGRRSKHGKASGGKGQHGVRQGRLVGHEVQPWAEIATPILPLYIDLRTKFVTFFFPASRCRYPRHRSMRTPSLRCSTRLPTRMIRTSPGWRESAVSARILASTPSKTCAFSYCYGKWESRTSQPKLTRRRCVH